MSIRDHGFTLRDLTRFHDRCPVQPKVREHEVKREQTARMIVANITSCYPKQEARAA